MFGLDLKSLIVGLILGWFVIPYVTSMLAGRRSGGSAA